MICSSRPPRSSPQALVSPATAELPAGAADERAAYGTPFWLAYVANSLISMSVAMLYHYADLVTLLGGTEIHLGWIVGFGVLGSLAMRFALGVKIDQYGPRRVWLASLAVYALVCFAHLGITTHMGPSIYLLRIGYYAAIAGIFSASITFISGRVSMTRMAELVGMLGTSGFMGIVVGALLGDLICGTHTLQRWRIDCLFIAAGCMGLTAMVFAFLATRHQRPPVTRRRRPAMGSLLWRYQPGTVLAVGVVVGAMLSLPATFLRTYATELSIPRIWFFFWVYSATAIITRIMTRRMPEQIGLVPMILLGLGILAGAEVTFLIVASEWQFIFPAVGYGIAHAILFPTITAAGTVTFPYRYRGLGTMVILAAFDLGALVGSPIAGAIVHFSGRLGLPGYGSMFAAMAIVLGMTGVMYALTYRPSRPQPHRGRKRPRHQRTRPGQHVLARSGGPP